MATGPLDALPAAARVRVVALTADALPAVIRLPPSLRRVAEFAPARRARLGTGAITAALADDEFRERVATQVAARAAADPDDAAQRVALAWLLRPEGWEAVVVAAAEELTARDGDPEREDGEAARLRQRLEQTEQTLREVRAAHRVQVDEYKAEVAALRRKLGEARAAERSARQESEAATRSAEERRTESEAAVAAQDKEVRRLRAQLERAEADLSAGRRAARAERDEGTLRARVLLDTVLEAAAGLQRELGLPPASGAPGDRVEQEVADAGAPAAPAAAVPGGATPALLEQYLAMPRARLLVDGYNVSKTAWPDSSLEAQRTRLLSAIAPVAARTGAETTVVFDAAASATRPVVRAPRGVKVLFSPEGVIADDVLRDLVAAEPPGRMVLVVSSDRQVATDVTRAGARAVAAEVLLGLLARTS
ncbi:NYN domain-containing protein [Nocardioides lianchengensis]|uniref:Predicted RNA-binding protein containing a PIN domain n=1 Tax=Nocardioides lianchengensis TaxID=1045774 RepID=A0A1G6MWV0_9ACTN|nr:NYN domain-containing protein [Nocardioides lianchengensis]NYG10565.1 putative RNA-binding protein with PIN domain [Nocardioides lianchengensis]SDC59687.1 Predicted RNA-binding protein containing a PIN domain [Nocardioides lianchengensis]